MGLNIWDQIKTYPKFLYECKAWNQYSDTNVIKNLNFNGSIYAFMLMKNYKLWKIYLALFFLSVERAILEIFVLHRKMTGYLSPHSFLLYMYDQWGTIY